ncbi:M64 family metallopeptidase [Parachryseolinea silvisoli]|jgi:hypothetical protein|uniref:M64 family metallopeptidase n=1 Tax=Parachryseolinea silvisoli TaxID=2873601 RepID=UPI002265AE01|nr:M64 family metallopeptidase [Parachryseolinea silvisoli]MCD9019288.1 FG-GAP-like repeat-containing protein [Parachryseolinea silvisoli]
MKFYLLVLLNFISIHFAMAQRTTLLRSGTAGTKFDLVIIGDGFQAGADQTTFNNYVTNTIVRQAFAEGPMWESLNAFNIYRLNLTSQESGVTRVNADGEVTVERNTALDYRYSGVWDRCWMEPGDNSGDLISDVLDENVPGWDFVVLVLNEASGGGCRRGNQLDVTLGSSWSTVAHELGHMVGNLADEYCRAGCFSGTDGQVNVTTTQTRSSLKWKDFVNPKTPVPTSLRQGTEPEGACINYNQGTKPAGWSGSDDAGLFEGAKYADACVFRPAESCRMRSNSPPYCPVCYNGMKTRMDTYHDYTFNESYVGDFDGDGKEEVVIHNDNSLALYKSLGTEIEPSWVATGSIPVWDDFKKGDKFFVGDFNGDGKDDLYVFNYGDWLYPYLGMLRSTGNGFECIKLFELKLPGWDDMKPNDTFFVGDFDGDKKEDLYVFNGKDWSMGYLEMLRSTGTTLAHVKRYDRDLPGWGAMLEHDQFYVGDLDGDNRDDLYVFNGPDWSMPYLEMLRSTGTQLSYRKRFDGTLPGWGDMRKGDKFYIGDINADNRSDVYVFNGVDWSMEYLLMLRSSGSNLHYVQRYDGDVPGWDGLAEHDEFYIGDANGDNKDDLFVFNTNDWSTEYLGILHSSGTALNGRWQDDWIGSWNMGRVDKLLIGNFNDGAKWDDVFIRNNNWFGLLRSYQSYLVMTAIHRDWIHRHKYHRLGWW